MLNVQCAYQEKEGLNPEDTIKGKIIVRFQEIKCHLILGIKTGGKSKGKDRFFASGHTTDPPSSLTYYNIISRYSVWLHFTLDALNDIDIWACDIGNAHLN